MHAVLRPFVLAGALLAAAGFSHAQAPQQGPQQAQTLQGKYCSSMAPKGWSVTGENAAGSAFGADFASRDAALLASYWIVGVAPEMRSSPWYGRWYATPHAAVMATLTRMGTVSLQCRPPTAPAPGLAMMECRNAQVTGLALYQVHPMGNGGFVIVMRTAGATPARWANDGAIASAVARSIRCNVPLKPSTADFTTGLSGTGKAGRKAEGDSGYSRWLEREHCHDPQTGQNYWVRPSTDWRNDGPQGPGYYAGAGGELRKLEPGRSD